MRTLFGAAAGLTLLLGVTWFFLPGPAFSALGIEPGPVGLYMTRRYGALFFGYTVILWLARRAEASAARTAILGGGAAVSTLMTVVSVIGGVSGVLGPMLWGAAVVEALLAAGFTYFWVVDRAKTAGGHMPVLAIEHVQLAMPRGEEAAAREFYQGLLGIPEVPKPPLLAERGGAWFERGPLKLHLGVEEDFEPARKAHPALLVADLGSLIARLEAHGVEVIPDGALEGYHRVYVADPFGNRIELMERV